LVLVQYDDNNRVRITYVIRGNLTVMQYNRMENLSPYIHDLTEYIENGFKL